MANTLKIILPTAGLGTRMRPQTWSKPKPLVSVAGRAVLGHQLDQFRSVPGIARDEKGPRHAAPGWEAVEFVIICSPGLGEAQIPAYMAQNHPRLKTHYALQKEMKGQADALWQAREFLSGPLLICFSDTLIETDFSFLQAEKAGGIAWVKPVPDPRRFGVSEVTPEGWVTRLIEKPQSMENKLVVVGCYYFKEGGDLLSAIQEQVHRGVSRKGEFFLADTINIMLEHGLKMQTREVAVWLDTGTLEATFETNRYLLDHGSANRTAAEEKGGVRVIPPSFIDPSAEISNSVVGPYVSIGAGCSLLSARVENSILEAGARVENAALKDSFLGRNARVKGRAALTPPLALNIGDDSSVILE